MVGLSVRYFDASLALITAHFASDSKGRNRVAKRNRVSCAEQGFESGGGVGVGGEGGDSRVSCALKAGVGVGQGRRWIVRGRGTDEGLSDAEASSSDPRECRLQQTV